MKNLKNYLVVALILLISSTTFTSCTNESELQTKQESITSTKRLNYAAYTTCTISGPVNVNKGAYTYTYNNAENLPNISWVITPESAAVIISGDHTNTVQIIFNDNCSIQALGTGGNDKCDETIQVTKSPNAANGDLCSYTPFFANEFYNYPVSGGGYIENAFYFGNRTIVPFDWSTVSSVKIQIGGVFGVGSNSLSVPNINTMTGTGMPNGDATTNWQTTPSGFRNIKIRTHNNNSNIDPGFLRNNTLGTYPGWATIKFNNGCPDKLLYLNDDPDFSFIN